MTSEEAVLEDEEGEDFTDRGQNCQVKMTTNPEWSYLSSTFCERRKNRLPHTIKLVTGSQAGDSQHRSMKWVDLSSMQGCES
jgi:hypothetical protein